MRLNVLLFQLVATCVALSSHTALSSEVCLRTLTSQCEDGKTACVKDCNGRVLDDLEYIEAEDAAEEEEDLTPEMDLEGDDALGIAVDYASGDERLVIEKLPKFTRWLYISNLYLSKDNPLAIPGSVAKLHNVYLTGQEITSLARVSFPKTLQLLSVFQSALTTLSDVTFPPKLSALYVTESAIASICATKFPPTLTLLDLHSNAISSLEGANLPASLESLDLSANKLQCLADIAFPSALKQLNLDGNGLTEISNVTLPATGLRLSLENNGIHSIRLTNPQWDAFENTFKDAKTLALEARPTSASQCTTGHIGLESAVPFTACLLEA